MRSSLVTLLAVLAIPAASAGDAAAIDWSPDRRLSWADFAGPVPVDADAERVASTAASISWSYEYSLEWSRERCEFRITRIDSAALFHPDRSWVREGHRTDDVLKHEQGHFDIAQGFRQRFDSATHEFVGSVHQCHGRSSRQAARYAEREISQSVGALYDDVWQAHHEQQQTYDRETRHGIDTDAQAEWSRAIAAELGL